MGVPRRKIVIHSHVESQQASSTAAQQTAAAVRHASRMVTMSVGAHQTAAAQRHASSTVTPSAVRASPSLSAGTAAIAVAASVATCRTAAGTSGCSDREGLCATATPANTGIAARWRTYGCAKPVAVGSVQAVRRCAAASACVAAAASATALVTQAWAWRSCSAIRRDRDLPSGEIVICFGVKISQSGRPDIEDADGYEINHKVAKPFAEEMCSNDSAAPVLLRVRVAALLNLTELAEPVEMPCLGCNTQTAHLVCSWLSKRSARRTLQLWQTHTERTCGGRRRVSSTRCAACQPHAAAVPRSTSCSTQGGVANGRCAAAATSRLVPSTQMHAAVLRAHCC